MADTWIYKHCYELDESGADQAIVQKIREDTDTLIKENVRLRRLLGEAMDKLDEARRERDACAEDAAFRDPNRGFFF